MMILAPCLPPATKHGGRGGSRPFAGGTAPCVGPAGVGAGAATDESVSHGSVSSLAINDD